MVDIADYEKRSDLTAPFVLTKKAEKEQRDREAIRDAVRCTTPRLTWAQYDAGEPCPGCGEPYKDEQVWAGKPTNAFTAEGRSRYEAGEARYRQRHGGLACRECGLDPATIVDGEAIGLVEESRPTVAKAKSARSGKSTKAELEGVGPAARPSPPPSA